MNYVKTKWEDRIVEFPNKYKDQNGNILSLIQEPGQITKSGTPVTAEKMNNIENGIYNNQTFSFSLTLNVANWVLNEETGYYEYDVANSNIDANTKVSIYMTFENQKKMSMAYTDSYDGGFKVISDKLPKENVEISGDYKKLAILEEVTS